MVILRGSLGFTVVLYIVIKGWFNSMGFTGLIKV